MITALEVMFNIFAAFGLLCAFALIVINLALKDNGSAAKRDFEDEN